MNEEIFISCIVPTKNSGNFIEKTFKHLHSWFLVHFTSHQIIFVDDCSNDNTSEILLSLKKNYKPYVEIVLLKRSLGQHLATLVGINYAVGKYITTFDDDMQYHVSDIKLLLNSLLCNKTDICYGIPVIKHYSSYYRKIINNFLTYILKIFFKDSVMLSSFRLMSCEIGRLMVQEATRFTNLEQLVKAKKIKFSVEYVQHKTSILPKSRYTIFLLSKFFVKTIIRYYWSILQFIIILLIMICILAFLLAQFEIFILILGFLLGLYFGLFLYWNYLTKPIKIESYIKKL